MTSQNAIQLFRRELSLTQAQLASRLHVSVVSVSRWENGKAVPNAAAATAIVHMAEEGGASESCLDALRSTLFGARAPAADKPAETIPPAFRQLIDQIPGGVGICRVYSDGRVEQTYLNEMFYEMLDVPREKRRDYIGFSTSALVEPGDREELQARFRAAIWGDRPVNAELRVRAGDETYKWLHLRASVILRDADCCTLCCAYTDIQAQKDLGLQLDTARQMIDLASEVGGIGLCVCDAEKGEVVMEAEGMEGVVDPWKWARRSEECIDASGIHSQDLPAYRDMCRKLAQGEKLSACTARFFNRETEQYEWRHVCIARNRVPELSENTVIGCVVNVGLKKEMEAHFSREVYLRRQRNKNADAYFTLNASTGVVEEYFNGAKHLMRQAPFSEAEAGLKKALEYVVDRFREQVCSLVVAEKIIEAFQRGEMDRQMEFCYRARNGDIRWAWITCRAIKRPSTDEIIAFVSIMDINAEKKRRLALNSVANEEFESVVMCNVRSRRVHIVQDKGKGSGRSVGSEFRVNEGFRQGLFQNILPEDLEQYAAFIKTGNAVAALREQPVLTCTYRVRMPEGRIERKKVRAFYLDETQQEIVYVRRDITDLYEEELYQKKVLQSAIDEANRANESKSEFISRVSHDMRTPLNAIIGLTDKELAGDAGRDELCDTVRKVHDAGHYLLGIINDVLDMSKIESDKLQLQLEPYSLEEFKHTVDTIIGEQCRKKGVHFRVEANDAQGPALMLDRVHFDQIFINLLSNAVKFTPAGGTVLLQVERYPIGGGRNRLRIAVQDNGVGMDPAFLPHAFERFAQETHKDRSLNNQGTGLGLSIAKQLAELMGGTISVESRKGEGSRFTVELECDKAEDGGGQAHPDEVELAGTRILLCEDHLLNAEIATRLLQKKGCEVECVANGELGLKRFCDAPEGHFDLVLMDLRMPVMDGMEAARAIRALERPDAKAVPIVAMTANVFEKDARTCSDAGMNECLTKPIEPEKLYETIGRLVSRRACL